MTFFEFGSEIAVSFVTLIINQIKVKKYGKWIFNSGRSNYVVQLDGEFKAQK